MTVVLPFDLQGGLAVAAARGLTVAALLSVFGTLVFRAIVAPKAFACMAAAQVAAAKRQLQNLVQASTALAMGGACLWLVAQAATMADAGSVRDAFAAVPVVLWKTSFGHVIALQFGALLILAFLLYAPPKKESTPFLKKKKQESFPF